MNSENEVFRSIYTCYRPVLLMVAAKKSIPADDRDDVVQDTFVKFFKYYQSDWSERKIGWMLIKFLDWCYVDSIRRQNCRPITYMDPAQIESGVILSVVTEKNDPQNMILKAEENQDVVDALKKIKPELSEAIVKLAIEERPVEEVSEELGITEAACRTRLSRGRSQMREIVYGSDSGTGRPNSSKADRKRRGSLKASEAKSAEVNPGERKLDGTSTERKLDGTSAEKKPEKESEGVKRFGKKDDKTARSPDSSAVPGSVKMLLD